jgi:filamentous hemagglutinin family protein
MNNPDQKTVIGKDTVHIELAPPSFTMRVGKRRLTMSWRARKPVPVLLTGLLRRSWRAMFGRGLRISMTAAAICAAWNAPAMAAGSIADNALPAGWSAAYGNASFTQIGNTLNINQTTQQAIYNFISFNIGKDAKVDITQLNAAANFLARVNTGTDPSLIYGTLKANGGVTLINQNGIMIGPNGTVDVARFIASTLDISNNDFLAGRMMFTTANVTGTVENQGKIQSATGGSVYLIGANVINGGVINSSNGEILLAAGQTVQLIDTATPGVSVSVTGAAGSVTNLGTISAEAGRIGIAAGLITNSGNINASSVVSEGGRIFLRASQNLTTTVSSKITADGATKGGSVVLYSDGAAYIDGDVSAQGAPGLGGFVETSGLKSLDVVKVPTVGSGGTWYIDPYDLEVVSDAFATANTDGTSVISSVGNSSKIRASTIVGLLNVGTDVTLTTGNSGGSDAGNITVSADINKVGVADSKLTLNAENNITINANITSSGSALNLTLNSYYRGDSGGSHDVNVNHADISLNGGTLTVTNGNATAFSGQGGLNLNSGSRLLLTQASSGLRAGDVTVDGTSSLVISQGSASVGTFTNSGTTNVSGSGTINVTGDVNNHNMLNLSGSGNVNVSGSINNTDTGTMNIDATSLHFNQTNSVNTSGTFNVNGGIVKVQGGNISGNVKVAAGAGLNLDFVNLGNATGATNFTGTGAMTWTGNITLLSNIALAATGPSLTFDGRTTAFVLTGATESLALNLTTNNNVTIKGNGSLDPRMVWNNSGKIDILANNLGDRVSIGTKAELNNRNGGVINISGPTTLDASAGAFSNDVGAAVNLATCATLNVGAGEKPFTNNGNITTVAVSSVIAGAFVNAGNITGAGALTAGTAFTNNQGAVLNMTGGSLSVGDAVNNQGSLILTNATITAPNGVNNDGSISVTGSGNSVTINGALLNNASGTVLVSGTGTGLTTGEFNNTGSLTLGVGGSATGTSFLNYGNTTLSGSGLTYSSVWNNEGANISGSGSIIAGDGFTNNGILSPGGDGTVGTLSVIGGYTQGATGVLNIDIAGASSYDILNVVSQAGVQMGGTLKTRLLGGYVPQLVSNTGPTFSPITSTGPISGFFRHVLGDVINTGGALQMIKANYNSGLTLGMAGSENITYSTAGEGQWGSQNSWSTGYIPTAIDNITINSGSLVHASQDGSDIVNSITIGNEGTLRIVGGDVTTKNLTSAGMVNIGQTEGPGGSLTVSGIAQMSSLSLTDLRYFLNGTAGSSINVTGNYTQANLGVINSQGNVTLVQTQAAADNGFADLTVGNITAANLTLASVAGSVGQTDSLHVTRQLTTSSATGTTLGNAGNQIAAYAGTNSITGDIALTNNLNVTDTSVVRIFGITNTGGNVLVDNTGGMATVGNINSSGAVSLTTHSPLTIGGNITAANGISLAAGTPGSGLAADAIIVNGQLTSTGGIISMLAGGSLSINGNIIGAFTPPPPPNPQPKYGVGVTLNGVLVGPAFQTAATSTSITPPVDTTSQIDRSVNNTQTTTTNAPLTSGTNPVIDNTQTTGGGAGSFGGDDTEPANGQSKPAGVKKVSKLYCS